VLCDRYYDACTYARIEVQKWTREHQGTSLGTIHLKMFELLNLRGIYYNTFIRFLNNYKQKSSYAYRYNHIYIKKRVTQNLKFTLPVTTFSIMWIVDRFITIFSMDLFIKYSVLYLLFLFIKPK